MSPLRNGNYYTNGVWYNQRLIVEESGAIMKNAFGDFFDTRIELGNLGKADPEIVNATGQEFYNMKLTILNSQTNPIEYGVVSQDGTKITMKGKRGVFSLHWISQKEGDALDADGDPIDNWTFGNGKIYLGPTTGQKCWICVL